MGQKETKNHKRVSQMSVKIGRLRPLSRMSDALQQRNDNMAIFSLKQPCYDGYSDRPNEEDKGAVLIPPLLKRGRNAIERASAPNDSG